MKIGEMFLAKSRRHWRQWLTQNGGKKREIWLVYFKKESGKQTMSYNDSVEEAICFGWIDGVFKSISKEQYVRRFTPRKTTGSNWSAPNRKRAKKMLDANRVEGADLKSCLTT